MNQPRKPKKVKAPDGCKPWFTPHKEYDVVMVDKHWNDTIGHGIFLINDNRQECICIEKTCGHLNGQDWIVTEYEDENN